ncbi:hypothetical protein T4B_8255 [Trichinella pseudospiralis]|uniref:Uncharacterized protein n=1 Tax=Trichinella pseudospiralis TaxID=6337 RepID=A0A0V1I6V1_TRIPS|nr:hypothetical protein T4B_8255 [Trichinella pseudospiralis]
MDHDMKRGKVETGASDSVRGEEEQIRELILRETLLHSTIVDDQSLCALSRQS